MRKTLLLSLIALLSLAPAHAADPFPNRPIKLLVGFAAGGPGDIPARYVMDKIGAALKTPVVVENKPGASSMLAVLDMLSQPRDGHTLLLCTHYDPINTALYKNVKFQLSDFAPISLLSKYYQLVAVSNSLPVTTIKEFIVYAKANPGKLNYGSLGPGSSQELAARQLSKLTGIEMTAIPYRGAAPAIQEMLAGRLDLYIGPPISIMPHYEAKKLKVLGVTAPSRLASAADVPTLTENGLPVVVSGWLGICAGSGVPQAVIERLNKTIKDIVATDEFRTLIEKAGSVAESSTPEDLARFMQETATDAGALIKAFNMQQTL